MLLGPFAGLVAEQNRRRGGGIVIGDVFDIVADTAANLDSEDLTGWDLVIAKSRANSGNWVWRDALGGFSVYMSSNTTADYASFTSYAALLSSGNAIMYKMKQHDGFMQLRSFSHTNGVASNVDLTGFGAIGLVYVKRVGATGDWVMWHRSLTAANNLRLNTNSSETTTNAYISVSGEIITYASAAPSGSYVVMAFAHNPGIIWCDTYTGNGSSSGPVIDLGGQPGFTQIKNIDTNLDHIWQDEARGYPSAGNSPWLSPNNTSADIAAIPSVEVSATGFDIVTDNQTWNGNGESLIYTAFATLT